MRLGFFVSHTGTNLQTVINACKKDELDAEICFVISNNLDAIALKKSRNNGIPSYHMNQSTHPGKLFEDTLLDLFQSHQVDLIILAGYMKKLPSSVVMKYQGQILNIHPALLPKFCGKGMYGKFVHEAVLASKDKVTGVTLHLVDEEYDTGPIVSQCELPVLPGDTVDSLKERVLKREHKFLVETIKDISNGKIDIKSIWNNYKAGILIRFLDSIHPQKWGIANIDDLNPFGKEFSKAISLLFPYCVSQVPDEEKFHMALEKIDIERKITINKIRNFMDKNGIRYYIGSFGNIGGHMSLFSHKLAATRAGLGWIGKNTQLITDNWGPRVKLSSIFIDMDVKPGTPVVESRCEDCIKCVNACPVHAIQGMNWYPGLNRNQILDADKCSGHLNEASKVSGRRFDCGICATICPIGRGERT